MTGVKDLMPGVLRRLAFDLTNKLTCTIGFLENNHADLALLSAQEAVHILAVFRQGIAVRDYEILTRDERRCAACGYVKAASAAS